MTTPNQVDIRVTSLIRKLSISGQPIFVSIKPDSESLPDNCFENVRKKMIREHGRRILGWQIWEFPYTLEAEFHAIWCSPNDQLIDITPKTIPVDKILFIEDSKLEYQGRQVDNVRLNLTENRLVDDLIELKKAKYRIENEAGRAFQNGIVTMTGYDSERWETVIILTHKVTKMIEVGLSENSDCFCPSMLSYNQCHGKILPSLLAKIS